MTDNKKPGPQAERFEAVPARLDFVSNCSMAAQPRDFWERTEHFHPSLNWLN
jgi:hypothetical protein